MEDYYIREGATFEKTFTDTDITAKTLTITISDDQSVIALTKTENYVVEGDQAVATLSIEMSLPPDEYRYMYTIEYDDGFILKLPDPEGCDDGSCELPKFVVCDANDVEGS